MNECGCLLLPMSRILCQLDAYWKQQNYILSDLGRMEIFYIPFGLLKVWFVRSENQFWDDRIRNKNKNNKAGLARWEHCVTNVEHYSLQLTPQHLIKEIGCHFYHHLFLLPRDMCKQHGGRAEFLANIWSLDQTDLIGAAENILPRHKRGYEYKNLPLLDCWVRGRLCLPQRIPKWKFTQI